MKLELEEVVKLINACKNAGVQRIKYQQLDVHFFAESTATDKADLPGPKPNREPIENLIEEDEDLMDLELQNLLIENPAAYEERLRKVAYGDRNQRIKRDVLA
jgi:hypothetical protein